MCVAVPLREESLLKFETIHSCDLRKRFCIPSKACSINPKISVSCPAEDMFADVCETIGMD